MYPKISIVTPNYNKGSFLEYTIKSVLSQNYPNLEYIIIDGGSTDNSIDIIRKYQDKLSYWVSEPDKGMYDAIRKGFSHATGEILAWIGSDDMYHPNCFNIVAEIFKNDRVSWLVGATTHFDKYGRCVFVTQSRYFSRQDLLSGDFRWIQQESSFWRKDLYDYVGGIDASLKYAGDFDLWLKFSQFEKMYVCNALLGGFRINNEGQLSLSMDKYLSEVMTCIKKQCTDSELEQLSILKMRMRFLTILNKLFNANLLRRLFFKKEFEITRNQKIEFERSSQQFRLK